MLTQVPEEGSDPEGQFSDDGLSFSPPQHLQWGIVGVSF